jgi:hypothetical protein
MHRTLRDTKGYRGQGEFSKRLYDMKRKQDLTVSGRKVKTRRVGQVVECLSRKHEALRSNPTTTKKSLNIRSA